MALDFSVEKSPKTAETAYWLRQIKASQKRLEKWRKKAKDACEIYEADRGDKTPFNILYSNTETLVPAIYNEPPIPICAARYKDDSPVSVAASQAVERMLKFVLDNPIGEYEGLHPLFENVVLSAAVPGLGALQLSYDADIDEYETATVDEEKPEAGDIDGQVSETAETIKAASKPQALPTSPDEPQAQAQVKSESICGKIIPFDRIEWGFAKRWKDVPWIAIAWDMTKADVEESFTEALAAKLPYTADKDSDGVKKRDADEKRPENTCRVWEIWHKSARKVLFLAEGYADELLKTDDDPLRLSAFFNIPEPLYGFKRITGTVPVTLYAFYMKQAEELNRLTQRIEKITEAIKVRGFYDKGIGNLEDLFTQDDNTLLPAEGVARMAENGSLDKSIWLVPIEKLASVLAQLQNERQSVKQVIYEITGISDILRGSSVASETATAQNIKNQWGSLRLKRFQKAVQVYIRNVFRMIGEIASEHFSEETWKKMTGLSFLLSAEKDQLGQKFQMAQQQFAAMQAQPPGAPGQQPQPGAPPGQPAPPNPQVQQAQGQLQQMQAELAKPSWGEILAVLKDDLLRSYNIDIETNSTVDPEAVEDKQAFGEMMQAFAQTLQQLIPAAQNRVLPMTVIKGILKATLKRFRFGPEVEGAINGMPDDLPQGPDPKQLEQQQKELQGQQQEIQKQQQALQQEQGKIAMEGKQLEMEKSLFEAQQQLAAEKLRMMEDAAKARIALAEEKANANLEHKKMQNDLANQTHRNGLDNAHTSRMQVLEQQAVSREAQRKMEWTRRKTGVGGSPRPLNTPSEPTPSDPVMEPENAGI